MANVGSWRKEQEHVFESEVPSATSDKTETIQNIFEWFMRKDDTHKSRYDPSFYMKNVFEE